MSWPKDSELPLGFIQWLILEWSDGADNLSYDEIKTLYLRYQQECGDVPYGN